VAYLQKWGDDDNGGQRWSDLGDLGGDLDDDLALPVVGAGLDDGHDQDDADDPPLQPMTVPVPVRRDGVRITIACACIPPRKIQASPGSFERGPVMCGVCTTNFVPAEPQRPRRRRAPREL
jgi:hypothetical protein